MTSVSINVWINTGPWTWKARSRRISVPRLLNPDSRFGVVVPRYHATMTTGYGAASAALTATALTATEAPRAGLDFAALLGTWPLLATARRGDGHPVLVLPGWLAGDPATGLLRIVLRGLGHNVSGWSLGTNRGPNVHVVHELRSRLEQLHHDSGRTVSLIGWSLGGMYAQELARASPGSVRRLITLGSPVLRRRAWTQNMSRIADRTPHLPRAGAALPRPWAESGSLRVPATSVYTRADGIVAWSTCRYGAGPRRENVEVRGSHLGLAHNPAVLWLLADRLGQNEGRWKAFRPPLPLRPFFPGRV
jgi:pimeloyl-ACP methyl ester carboxylesterase